MSEHQCAWCGAGGIDTFHGDVTYACGSWAADDMASQSERCLIRQRNQLLAKCDRMQKAGDAMVGWIKDTELAVWIDQIEPQWNEAKQ